MPPIAHVCTTCGIQQPPSEMPPAICPICADGRQYVNPAGQSWTTLEQIAAERTLDWRELEPGLFGLGATPPFAIGQRALFLPQSGGGVLWDLMRLATPETVARLKAEGGVRAIAISHPHFFSTMAEWSAALGDVPIYLHEDLAPYVQRPTPAIRFWSGETHDLGQGITLIRCGGHYSGSTVLHWPAGAGGRGALLSGDTIMVAADTRWMSFMRSFPNYIPLNRAAVEHIVAAVLPYPFERVYGAWWPQVSKEEGKERLKASAARYILAISD